ncbi:hypothetical protein EVAR_29351_1 [Eumeta japonica]|uniref:Uncharacterized protein n=1 Tax=Eumeta variegata TaxID=151549 RepID=A0A4C1WJC0_EUMVA|nr:hypothetical protein EVAR_29351_1 [Eumeta japonica]
MSVLKLIRELHLYPLRRRNRMHAPTLTPINTPIASFFIPTLGRRPGKEQTDNGVVGAYLRASALGTEGPSDFVTYGATSTAFYEPPEVLDTDKASTGQCLRGVTIVGLIYAYAACRILRKLLEHHRRSHVAVFGCPTRFADIYRSLTNESARLEHRTGVDGGGPRDHHGAALTYTHCPVGARGLGAHAADFAFQL